MILPKQTITDQEKYIINTPWLQGCQMIDINDVATLLYITPWT